MKMANFCAGMVFGVMLVAMWGTAPSHHRAQSAAHPQPQQCLDGDDVDVAAFEWAGR